MITDRQREARIEGIGSSDAAAILGFSPWRTAADVQAEKLGLVEPWDAGELAEIGNYLEDGVANLAARRLGVRLVKPAATFVHPEHDCLRANVDRQVDRFARGQPIVECKDSGLDDDWGEPGTGEVPPYVLCQVAHQLLCSDAPEAHIARLGRGFKRGLFLYRIATTDDGVARLIDAMLRFLPAWWQRHVVNHDPLPAGSPPPSWDTLRRLRREPVSTVLLDDELVLEWRRAEEEFKRAEDIRDGLKRRVIAALGTAEGGTSRHGAVTYFEQTRREYVVKESTFRVIRFKPTK